MFHLDSMNMKKMFWPNTTWISEYFWTTESSSIVSISSPKRDSINSRQVVKIIKSTKEKKDIGKNKKKKNLFYKNDQAEPTTE